MKQIFFMITEVVILFIACLFKPTDIINGVITTGERVVLCKSVH